VTGKPEVTRKGDEIAVSHSSPCLLLAAVIRADPSAPLNSTLLEVPRWVRHSVTFITDHKYRDHVSCVQH
jgi:hypothetical protein